MNGQTRFFEGQAMKLKLIVTVFLVITYIISLCSLAFAEDSDLVITENNAFEGPHITGVLPPALSILGIVKLPELRLVAMKLSRGTEVEIVDESDEFYYFQFVDGSTYCTEKELVCLKSDIPSFQEVSGFAKYNTCVYQTPYFTGNEFTKLAQNTELTVLDRLRNLMLVSWKGTDNNILTGYMDAGSFSQSYIQDWYPSGGGGTSGGGSFGGGSSSGSGGGTASSGGQDGGDIVLASRAGEKIHAEVIASYNNGAVPSREGVIFADGTNAYLMKTLQRGDELLIASREEEKCKVWLDGTICEVDSEAVRLAEDNEYEAWIGFIQPNGVLYILPEPESEGIKESTNTEVLVEDEYHDMYIVSLNGKYYCAEKSFIKSSKYWYDPSWNSGGGSGGSGGSSSGSGSSGSSSGSSQQWTDPVL